ncbi:MAG TPA: hypothetical protein VHI93_00795, partial [Candidatus Thermoplasmatota archaeon]|nr:hypothetical protein [Candidatus Thermoplasmatota archaeon]
NLVPDLGVPQWLFWQRPLFSLLLWPGAAISFEGYRVWHILLSSLLAPLALAVVAQAGGRRVAQWATGVAVALLPGLVGWGVRVFPDSLMAVLFLCAVWLHGRGWHGRAALAFLAAAWVKEVAAVGLLAAFAAAAWTGRRRGEVGLWPFRLDKPATAHAAAGLLAPLPLAFGVLVLGGAPPGWSSSKATLGLLDGLFVSAWLLPAVLLGLRWPRTRRLSLWALVLPLFYATYGFVLHRGVEAWYLVLPQVLALVAAALALEEGARRAATPAHRRAGQAVAVALCAVLAAAAVLPDDAGARAAALPFGGGWTSLPGLHGEAQRPHPLEAPLAALPLDRSTDVFVVDVDWFYAFYPFAEVANSTGWAFTSVELPLSAWTVAVEGPRATLVATNGHPLNVALREAYADCRVWQGEGFEILHGHACPGRLGRLREALERAGG